MPNSSATSAAQFSPTTSTRSPGRTPGRGKLPRDFGRRHGEIGESPRALLLAQRLASGMLCRLPSHDPVDA